MTYEKRLEEFLLRLARVHAPVVLESWSARRTEPNALGHLARKLADFNILVLTGEMTPSLQHIADDTPRHLEAWVNTYGEIYKAFVGALFSKHNPNITGHHTDSQWPVIIYLRGVITPVIQTMADYVVPYIAVRQTEPSITTFELVGLVDMMLMQLEGQDIHHDVRTQLQNTCVQHLNTLLSSPIRQYPLMPGVPDLFADSRPVRTVEAPPPPVQTQPPPPPPVQPPPKPSSIPGMMPPVATAQPPEPVITTWEDTGPLPPLTEPPLPPLQDTGAQRPNGDTQQLSDTNPLHPGDDDPLPAPDVPDTVTPAPDTDEAARPLSSDLRNFFGTNKRNTQEPGKRKPPPTWLLRPHHDDDKKE